MAPSSEKQSGDELATMLIITIAIAVVFVQLARVVTGGGLFTDSLFVDGDVYSWLNRVEALADGRSWFDHTEPRINPPEGHEQHWTRPVDFLLLIGGWVLSPIFGFRDGLALWANAISPIIMIGAIWAMYRVAGHFLERREAIIATGVFALHPMILLTYAWGRADHHALLRLGQVLFLLAFLNFFLKSENRNRWALAAGFIGAWSIWFNIEAMGFVLIAMAVLGLWWLIEDRGLALCNLLFSAGLFAGIVSAVLIERGPYFFEFFPIDTIGFPYVVLFALTLVFWACLWAWTEYGGERGGLLARAGVAALSAGVVLVGIALWMPAFFDGPFGEVDELYRNVRLEFIGEQLPAVRWIHHSPLASVGRIVALFGALLVALWAFWKKIRHSEGTSPRWAWAMMGGTALLYGLLSLDTVRWAAYMPAVAAPGFAVVGGAVMDWVEDRYQRTKGALWRPLAVGGLLLGFTTLGLFVETVGHTLDERKAAQQAGEDPDAVELGTEETMLDDLLGTGCDLRVAVQVLDGLDEVPPEALIAVDPDRGSEMLYRTDHGVLAIANHRYQPGFTFFFEVMTSHDMEESHRRMAERGVAATMVCEPQIWPTLRDQGQTVIERLGSGEYGAGFEVLATPEETAGWWIYGVGFP